MVVRDQLDDRPDDAGGIPNMRCIVCNHKFAKRRKGCDRKWAVCAFASDCQFRTVLCPIEPKWLFNTNFFVNVAKKREKWV